MAGRKEQIGRHCPYCGAIITYDEYFCRACHKRLTDQMDLDVPSHHKPAQYVVSVRNGGISILLSSVFPGLGQFYNGDTLRGTGFTILFLLVSFGSILPEYRTDLFLVVWMAAGIEALMSTRRINTYARHFRGTSYLLWIGLAGLAILVLLHASTGLPDMDYLRKIFPALWLISFLHLPLPGG